MLAGFGYDGPQIVTVCGSRSLANVPDAREIVFNVLDYINANYVDFDIVLHGGAPGPDLWADQWAKESGFTVEEHRPDYSTGLKRRAPIIRNHKMVDMSQSVVAFWDGVSRGTKIHTADYALDKGLYVYLVEMSANGDWSLGIGGPGITAEQEESDQESFDF